MNANTLFLRLEGPLQAWGDHRSKFVVRRTGDVPTKSGVFGMVCAALGVSRREAAAEWLPRLRPLAMGVRVDVPGVRWWDYHTAGAGYGLMTAGGNIKITASTGEFETLVSRREYLCDASFLVALRGEPALIAEIAAAVEKPRWTFYLGRRSCPPSRPIFENPPGAFPDLISALSAVPWRARYNEDAKTAPNVVTCFVEWVRGIHGDEAPGDAIIYYDVPATFAPPSHDARLVVRKELRVGPGADVEIAEKPAQRDTPRPPRPRTTVQHVTYRRAGGNESQEDLRSLCRLCHDAVTMLEYGLGMGLDRINPEDPRWRDQIIRKRREIIAFRSLETRRRRLAAEEVE